MLFVKFHSQFSFMPGLQQKNSCYDDALPFQSCTTLHFSAVGVEHTQDCRLWLAFPICHWKRQDLQLLGRFGMFGLVSTRTPSFISEGFVQRLICFSKIIDFFLEACLLHFASESLSQHFGDPIFVSTLGRERSSG